jgi:hypothetical protein
MLAVNETVALMTRSHGKLVLEAPEAFPSVPMLGYQEWQRDYERLRTAYSLIRTGRSELQADFESALMRMPEGQRRAIRDNANTSLDSLDRAVMRIDGRLDAITRAEVIGARYRAFEGVDHHIPLAIGIVSIAVLGGIVLPLTAPLIPRFNNRVIAAIGIACGLVPTVLLVIGFLWYAWRIPATSVGAYAPVRWLAPLHAELQSHAADLYYLRPVDQTRVLWATAAIDASDVSPAIRAGIAAYSQAIDVYNRRHGVIVGAIGRFMSDSDIKTRLSSLNRPARSGSSSSLTPIALLDSSVVRETVARTADAPSSSLSIEGPVSLNIPGEIVRDNRDSLLRNLGMVRSRTCDSMKPLELEESAKAALLRLFEVARLLDATTSIQERTEGYRVSPTTKKLQPCSS